MCHARTAAAVGLALIVCGNGAVGCNNPPATPDRPSGPAALLKDSSHTFTTSARDPDGDQVSLCIDAGNGDTTEWSEWVESGERVRLGLAWSSVGTYEVRAQSRDPDQAFSEWSDPLQVKVGLPLDVPGTPSGPSAGFVEAAYRFGTFASNPDPGGTSYRFNWGDGRRSEWTEYTSDSAWLTHAWDDPGLFDVTAQARNVAGCTTGWSGPASITVAGEPGTVRWRYLVPGRLFSSPALDLNGVAYFGSWDGYLYALNPDGTLGWKAATHDSWTGSSPAIGPDGTIYIGSINRNLYAFNPDGTLRWQYLAGGDIASSPALGTDGAVFFGCGDGCLYRLNPDGSFAWRVSTGGQVYCSPSIGPDGTIYLGSYDHTFYAFSPDGSLKWSIPTGGAIQSSPAIGPDGTVYFGSYDKYFYAVRPDGSLRWQYELDDWVYSSPAIAGDGTVYFACGDEWFYALNPDGTLKWTFETSGEITSSPAIDTAGNVYFGSRDEMLYAVGPDGSKLWSYDTGDDIMSSPVMAPDGTVIIGTDGGVVFALWSQNPPAGSPWPMFRHDAQHTGRAGD